MVFNDTHNVSCPILGLLGAAQHTHPLPVSAFKASRNCSLPLNGQDRQNKITILAKILETSISPHSITSCSGTYY